MYNIILNSSAPGGVQTRNGDDVQQQRRPQLNFFYTILVLHVMIVEFEIKQKEIVDNLYIKSTSNFIK